jgi:hypothetical protein
VLHPDKRGGGDPALASSQQFDCRHISANRLSFDRFDYLSQLFVRYRLVQNVAQASPPPRKQIPEPALIPLAKSSFVVALRFVVGPFREWC